MPRPTQVSSRNPDPPLRFRAVDAKTLGDFEGLFSSPGAPSYCWCMVWRRTPEEARNHDGRSRRTQMLQRIKAGVPVGLVAYRDDEPFAWVSIAPRETYRSLGGPPAEPGQRIWSLVCFFVPRRERGQGTIHALITGAVDHARKKGATVVEAYPVDAAAPSYRFMGFVDVFAAEGFHEVGRAGNRRHVMRLPLD
jgi:GNAT superfamily N-acetyltransferase